MSDTGNLKLLSISMDGRRLTFTKCGRQITKTLIRPLPMMVNDSQKSSIVRYLAKKAVEANFDLNYYESGKGVCAGEQNLQKASRFIGHEFQRVFGGVVDRRWLGIDNAGNA